MNERAACLYDLCCPYCAIGLLPRNIGGPILGQIELKVTGSDPMVRILVTRVSDATLLLDLVHQCRERMLKDSA